MRTVLLLMTGNSAAFLFSLLRNLLLARLLPVEDYGIAATFAMIIAVVEMAATFGLQLQIVQARDGDAPHFQAALQGFQLLRGLIAGAALWLISGVMADFLGIPEVAWAYQMLALMPVLNALVHFDIHRFNRRMVFGPMLWSGALPALLALLAIWPLMWWLGDWRVMLASMLLQGALAVAVSHLLAERRWRIGFDRAIYAGALRFGWPLMLNSLLLFLVFQGDKLLIGHALGMAPLALFAMGMTLTLSPTLVFGKTLQNLFLPQLTQAADGAAFRRLALKVNEANLLLGGLFAVVLALLAGPLVMLLLGAKYADLALLLPAFGVMQALRQGKGGASTVAVASGQTENALYANMLRVLSLPVSWVLVQQGHGLAALIGAAILGEAAGLALALWVQRHRQGVALQPLLPLLLGWSSTLSLALVVGAWPQSLAMQGLLLLAALAMCVGSPWARGGVRGALRRGRARAGGG